MKAIYSSKTGQLSSGQNKIILPKQLKICLEFFIKNEGKVVTKDDIFHECWGSRGVIVSDSTLRQSLYKLRKAFSDIGVEQEILVNHSRNNYYLVTGILELNQEVGVNPEVADEQSEPISQSETNSQLETSSQSNHHAVSSANPHAKIMSREVPFYNLCALITTFILFFYVAWYCVAQHSKTR